MFGIFNGIGSDYDANKVAADFVRQQVDNIVKDSATAGILKPVAYPLGAKRIPLETNYYQTYNQGNVKLVDLLKYPISHMTHNGLIAGDVEHTFDLVIFATGFQAITGPMVQIDVTGGQKLKDVWSDGPYSYLRLSTPGFPNLFTLAGPGVISNVPPTLEHHVEWVAECLAHLRDREIDEIEAIGTAANEWIQHVHSEAQQTMYPHAPSSWYDGSSITGKPRPFPAHTSGFGNYRRICNVIAADNYHGFAMHQKNGSKVDTASEIHPAGWYADILSN